MTNFTYQEIARMIDHALLHPALTLDEMDVGIQTALEYQVASVCILPFYMKRCARLSKSSGVKASTTIGFPHGSNATPVKFEEARHALEDGCEEIDFVVNISQVLSGNWDYVRTEIAGLIDLAHGRAQKAKVIFENCYLNEAQKIRLCEICSELDADWVKSSTGFGSGGATVEDIRLMRKHSASNVMVKAAGGIRDLDTLLAMRAAGATRIGSSSTAAILEECKRRGM